MTETQQLLAAYVIEGSEEAFRGLVERYIHLVFSTALRLVDGDAHLAEDVTQMVFARLARRARSLKRESLLGGWLHRDTCYVATKVMRCERRRQARERQAVLMNTLPDPSEAGLEQVAPVLDNAINRLGQEDRRAILLRFFEQLDYRQIGAALGSTEDAARMRVTRALEKLRLMVARRGVTLSAGALATLLAGQAVNAAPAGLAVSVAGTVLAGSSTGVGLVATLLKGTLMTKAQVSLVSAVVLASATTTFVIEHQARARMHDNEARTRQQLAQLAEMQDENQRLSNLLASTKAPGTTERDELFKLRGDIDLLRTQMEKLARAKEENRQLQATLNAARQPSNTRSAWDFLTPEQRAERTKMLSSAKQVSLGLRLYANDNDGQFPINFDQATNETRNMEVDRFELIYQGTEGALKKYAEPGNILLLREKQPLELPDGQLVRIYSMVDGGAHIKSGTKEELAVWEKQHTLTPEPQNP